MANNKSAKKRIKINKRNKIQNNYYKTSVRNLMKNFFKTLELYKLSTEDNDKKEMEVLLSSIFSLLDKGAKKNVFHRNMVARQKSKLVSYLKSS